MSLIAENFTATTIGSCSQANGDDLPTDVLYEIFIRLPLKPVFKFRCVSKLWNSLLSDTSLVRKVFSITTSPPPWTIVSDRGDFFARNPQVFQTNSLNIHYNFINDDHTGFSFQFLFDNAKTFWNNIMSEVESESSKCKERERWDYSQVPIPRVKLFSSCVNGLVLYKLCPKVDISTHPWDQLTFNVCNPLTKQCVSLPPRPEQSSIQCHFVGLVSESSTTSNYKVVFLGGARDSHTATLLQVFSSDTGEWRTYAVDSCEPCLPSKTNMVISNGVVYWNEFLADDSGIYIDHYQMVVRAFNLENKNIPKNTLRSIYFPEDREPHSLVFFGVSEGSIYYGNISRGFLSVWMLKEDFCNEGWVWQPVHTNIKMKYHSIFIDCRSYCYFHPEDRNVIIFLETPECPCFAYKANTRTYEVLCASPIPPSMVDNGHYFLPLLIAPKPTRIPLLSPSRRD